jgi:hypothetical protein
MIGFIQTIKGDAQFIGRGCAKAGDICSLPDTALSLIHESISCCKDQKCNQAVSLPMPHVFSQLVVFVVLHASLAR